MIISLYMGGRKAMLSIQSKKFENHWPMDFSPRMSLGIQQKPDAAQLNNVLTSSITNYV